jgi:hypothetical protein
MVAVAGGEQYLNDLSRLESGSLSVSAPSERRGRDKICHIFCNSCISAIFSGMALNIFGLEKPIITGVSMGTAFILHACCMGFDILQRLKNVGFWLQTIFA